MRALQRLLGILFVLAIWTGCGDDPGVVDYDLGVIDRHCAYRLDCGWEDDFGVCRQSAISGTAAFTHVYGSECGEAWLDLLDCESFLPCEAYLGCQPENARFDELCF